MAIAPPLVVSLAGIIHAITSKEQAPSVMATPLSAGWRGYDPSYALAVAD
jgi:hypothetical protein